MGSQSCAGPAGGPASSGQPAEIGSRSRPSARQVRLQDPRGGRLMSKLAASISVRARFARSANLERDLERREPLDGYIVTSRALDVVGRIAETAATGPAGGAWSVTGPYGSGKSSLALLIDAAFGGDSAVRQVALRLIDESSREVGAQIRRSHHRHGTESCGFHRGLVTAGREPLNRTVLWALYSAVLRSHGGIPSRTAFRASAALKGALADAESDDPRRTGPSPSALVGHSALSRRRRAAAPRHRRVRQEPRSHPRRWRRRSVPVAATR